MENQTIDEKLLFAQNAISNASNVEAINTILADYGYDAAAYAAGLALQENAQALHLTQKKEYGEQYAATAVFNEARDAVNKTYMRHLKLARVALKGDLSLDQALQLSGDRKQAFPAWLQQAKAFYTNALLSPSALAELAKLNIPAAALTATKDELLQVEKKYNIQLKEKGEAQLATETRDYALDDLQDWMSRFIEIAKVALEDEPQLLEMLGIVVKKSGGKAATEEEPEEPQPEN